MDRIRSLGGKFDSSVNNDTTYLVVGESPGEAKITKAKSLGTKQLNEDSLKHLLDTKA